MAVAAVRGADQSSPRAPSPSTREPHWDALRALLMLLGIPFHATHPFRVGGGWMISSPDQSVPLTYVMHFLHLFRMHGFFVIAGYFAAMLLARRDPAEWLRGRMTRLGIPLVFGLIVLVPIMHLGVALQSAPPGGVLASWADQTLPPSRSTTEHLWFLIVLIYYSALAAGLVMLMPGRRLVAIAPSLDRRIAGHAGLLLFLYAVATGCFTFLVGKMEGRVMAEDSFAADVLTLHFAWMYAPYFALGMIIQRTAGLRSAVTRWMWPLTVIGAGAAFVLLTRASALPWALVCILRAVAAIGLSQFLIAGVFALFNRGHPWVKEVVDASFAIYLLHLPALVFLFWAVDGLPLPVTARFLLLTIGTLALCWAAWLVIRRHAVLQLLFSGLSPGARTGSAPRPIPAR
ncbi:acyltransferase family protein [Sphingomonas sp. IC4-52]|uniref:acyltransferase family protein n=1 Tax=Sphingomonas sp. IC4-52 TaxID=2887202 RepID=UPI001D0FB557|nr:acyltransferase family protein [Sphingomonas sp. IC4-52]MCC2980838.1 acyltransferase family protein [Sphingomonas sp. IC4-52]